MSYLDSYIFLYIVIIICNWNLKHILSLKSIVYDVSKKKNAKIFNIRVLIIIIYYLAAQKYLSLAFFREKKVYQFILTCMHYACFYFIRRFKLTIVFPIYTGLLQLSQILVKSTNYTIYFIIHFDFCFNLVFKLSNYIIY